MLDIIIVNYNSTDYLLACLKSIYDSFQNNSGKIFVQDNASEDAVDRVSEMFPQVILSRNSQNIGFAKAVNNALLQTTKPYIALLNPDSYITNNSFEPIVRYMAQNPEVGIAGPKILNRDGSVQGSARLFPTPLTALFGRSSLLSKWFPDNPITRRNVLIHKSDGTTPVEVDWVSGACMVVNRKALDETGLLDERFFLYWEDVDWCKRMWQEGWKVVYFTQSQVVHYIGGSSDKRIVRSVVDFHRSCYRFCNKYMKSPLRLTKPLIAFGLSLRLLLVLLFHSKRMLVNKLANYNKFGDITARSEDIDTH